MIGDLVTLDVANVRQAVLNALDKTLIPSAQNAELKASWTYVASKAGEYAYGCTFHPTMKAILNVQ